MNIFLCDYKYYLLSILYFLVSCGEQSNPGEKSIQESDTLYDDNSSLSMDDFFSYDYIHPSQSGHQSINNFLVEEIKKKWGDPCYSSLFFIKPCVSVEKMMVVGDSIASGYRKVSAQNDLDVFIFSNDSFGILLASFFGLSKGYTTDLDFVYPQIDNSNIFSRINILNQGPYHLIAFPGARLEVFNLDVFSERIKEIQGNQLYINFWQKSLGKGISHLDNAISTINPDTLVLTVGNNDVLQPISSEGNNFLITKTLFKEHYRKIFFDTSNNLKIKSLKKVVMFKVPNILLIPMVNASQNKDGVYLFEKFKKILSASDISQLKIFLSNSLWGETNKSLVHNNNSKSLQIIDLENEYIKLNYLTNFLEEGFQNTQDNPVPDSMWLDKEEILEAESFTKEYNVAIDEIAQELRKCCDLDVLTLDLNVLLSDLVSK